MARPIKALVRYEKLLVRDGIELLRHGKLLVRDVKVLERHGKLLVRHRKVLTQDDLPASRRDDPRHRQALRAVHDRSGRLPVRSRDRIDRGQHRPCLIIRHLVRVIRRAVARREPPRLGGVDAGGGGAVLVEV